MHEMSLARFIEHMAGMTIAIEHETHAALENAARIVETEATAEIGHYQDEVGPFVAWAALADSTLAEKESLGYAPPDNPLLREGDLRDSIEHTVSGHEAAVGSNSEVAVYQELGTSKMPPRSFLGGAAVRKADDVAEICGAGVVKALVGEKVVGRYLALP